MTKDRRSFRGLAASALALFAPLSVGQDARDPTVPPAEWVAVQPVDPGAQSALNLKKRATPGQMMVVGATRRIAIVDGKVLRAGDEHNGAKVMAVRTDKVVMDDDAKSLALIPGVAKQKPAAPATKGPVVLPVEDRSSKDKGV